MWICKTQETLSALASRLAPYIADIDFVGLHGEVGAGKTVFARSLLSALGVKGTISSPTYGIVHTHEGARQTVFHCDFYRLRPEDADEVGVGEMLETGAVVAEWPSAIALAPENRLDVRIEARGDERRVFLNASGSWKEKLARFEAAESFLEAAEFGDAVCTGVRGDASSRTFARLTRQGRTAFLMDWPVKDDGPPVAYGLPYCQLVHLARDGHPVLAITEWLRDKAGLYPPTIYVSDTISGFYIIEDLGDDVFGALIAAGEPASPLYKTAVDGLLAIRRATPGREFPSTESQPYAVPVYDRRALETELELILDWYHRLTAGYQFPEGQRREFLSAWAPYLEWLETQDRTLVLRDYHSPNLILIPANEGLRALGVIDFQDAVWGHPAYDLVSLLQDARLTVPEDLERELLAYYCEQARSGGAAFDEDAFRTAYAILGAQRNTKVLGIFARLYLRDGKKGYLVHLPRIITYLLRNLAHPNLAALHGWYRDNLFKPFAKGASREPSEEAAT